jgi:hypothetical protein
MTYEMIDWVEQSQAVVANARSPGDSVQSVLSTVTRVITRSRKLAEERGGGATPACSRVECDVGVDIAHRYLAASNFVVDIRLRFVDGRGITAGSILNVRVSTCLSAPLGGDERSRHALEIARTVAVHLQQQVHELWPAFELHVRWGSAWELQLVPLTSGEPLSFGDILDMAIHFDGYAARDAHGEAPSSVRERAVPPVE